MNTIISNKNSHPRVSTLICTYNAQEFFDITIQSVVDQTYTNQEILIRDDCSTDNTVQILHQRAEKDSRVRLFIEPGKKRGPYGGLNYLLDHAQGEYIAIQDHDDIWHPEKLEKQITFLENNLEFEGCGSEFSCYYEEHNLYGPQQGISAGGKKQVVHHTSLMYRKTEKRYDLSKKRYTDFYFCLSTLGKQYQIKETLMIHRKRTGGTNLFNTRNNGFFSRFELRKKNPTFFSFLFYTINAFFGSSIILFISMNITNKGKYRNEEEFLFKNEWAKM